MYFDTLNIFLRKPETEIWSVTIYNEKARFLFSKHLIGAMFWIVRNIPATIETMFLYQYNSQ